MHLKWHKCFAVFDYIHIENVWDIGMTSLQAKGGVSFSSHFVVTVMVVMVVVGSSRRERINLRDLIELYHHHRHRVSMLSSLSLFHAQWNENINFTRNRRGRIEIQRKREREWLGSLVTIFHQHKHTHKISSPPPFASFYHSICDAWAMAWEFDAFLLFLLLLLLLLFWRTHKGA